MLAATSKAGAVPGATVEPGGGDAMRVLGLDPGIATFGYGVAERVPGAGHAAMLTMGVLRPRGPDGQRLQQLYRGLSDLITRFRPERAAVERVFHTRNVSTAAAVGQARGVALLVCAQQGLAVSEYTPTEMKLAVAGYGGADKRQVQTMVALQLGLDGPPKPDDAADALGLCLCCLWGQGLEERIGQREVSR